MCTYMASGGVVVVMWWCAVMVMSWFLDCPPRSLSRALAATPHFTPACVRATNSVWACVCVCVAHYINSVLTPVCVGIYWQLCGGRHGSVFLRECRCRWLTAMLLFPLTLGLWMKLFVNGITYGWRWPSPTVTNTISSQYKCVTKTNVKYENLPEKNLWSTRNSHVICNILHRKYRVQFTSFAWNWCSNNFYCAVNQMTGDESNEHKLKWFSVVSLRSKNNIASVFNVYYDSSEGSLIPDVVFCIF